jgi:hypothetical protein
MTRLLAHDHESATLTADRVRAIDAAIRDVRVRAFPPGYFAETAWELLLELDSAVRSGRAIPVANDSPGARYLSLLERDGFVERRHDPVTMGGEMAVLTPLGQLKLDEIFVEAALAA